VVGVLLLLLVQYDEWCVHTSYYKVACVCSVRTPLPSSNHPLIQTVDALDRIRNLTRFHEFGENG
jgi:hypothetical protein